MSILSSSYLLAQHGVRGQTQCDTALAGGKHCPRTQPRSKHGGMAGGAGDLGSSGSHRARFPAKAAWRFASRRTPCMSLVLARSPAIWAIHDSDTHRAPLQGRFFARDGQTAAAGLTHNSGWTRARFRKRAAPCGGPGRCRHLGTPNRKRGRTGRRRVSLRRPGCCRL